MPQVIIEQPGVPPMTVPLCKEETRFGRSEDSDVVLVADEVSRHHAKICLKNDKPILVDLKSLNGTYVNRQRIVERVLAHMDEIWFGSKCRLVFRDDTQLGRKTSLTPPEESQLLRNMDKIRAEMDRVGSSMTMIGTRTPVHIQEKTAAVPPLNSEEVVKMGRAYRRLAALHRAGQVMASNFELNARLSSLLDIALEVMEAERGFVMLREEGTTNLTVKVARGMGRDLEASSPSMGIAGRAAIDGEPVLMADRSTDREFGMRESIIRNQIRSAMCVPLRIHDRVLGSIYVDTTQTAGSFGEEDLELFQSLANQSALAIDNVRLHQQVVAAEKKRENLGRFLSPAIVDKIINEESRLELGGRKQRVTTMFCDIRGSSKIAEQLQPHELVQLLNEHFTAMTEIVFAHHGTLDKYIGDELMAVFGSPICASDDCLRAIRAALAIQRRNAELNAQRAQDGRVPLDLGIGIDTGEVIAGYVGSPQRMEFTVVGDRVNTAKRFCDMAGAGKVVVGQELWDEIKGLVVSYPIGSVMLKGKAQPVNAYEIAGLKE
ncbi:MAG: FHA domain-containing protein [Candidatus Hydrogenedentes bacterium]|nr:FHA domain-containing protein [Candidatus Hydrogenedentota bacterium]